MSEKQRAWRRVAADVLWWLTYRVDDDTWESWPFRLCTWVRG